VHQLRQDPFHQALRLLFLFSVVRRVGWSLGGDGAALRLRSLRRLLASPRHSSGAAPSDCGARPQEPLLGLGLVGLVRHVVVVAGLVVVHHGRYSLVSRVMTKLRGSKTGAP